MKALPLRYAGTLFRSRLEADFAATLTAHRMPWQYEPEGFELSDGSCYSPDFYLPTAKAWLEVKGDHNLGLPKAETFAADLWRRSGATSTHDRDAPMVLLGRGPDGARHEDAGLKPWWRVVGVMGPGKAYSVLLPVQCCRCDQWTAVALWQRICRACGWEHDDGLDAWMDSSMDRRLNGPGWQRVTRPAGRS